MAFRRDRPVAKGAPVPDRTHLAVAPDGAGWHPAARREPGARPTEPTSAGSWRDIIRTPEGATPHDLRGPAVREGGAAP